MKKIIVIPEYMDADTERNRVLDETIPVEISFKHVFEGEEDVVCEYYVYNLHIKCFENLDNMVLEPESTSSSTIHKFVFTTGGKVSFIDTGCPDILSAISEMPEEEMENSIFCIDLWADNVRNGFDTRVPMGGLPTCEALEKLISKTTKNLFFCTRCYGDEAQDFIDKMEKKYKELHEGKRVYHFLQRYEGNGCYVRMFKDAKELCDKYLSSDDEKAQGA